MAETGFLDRTLKLAGDHYRYQVYVPATYTPLRGWPVILFLHGAGESGEDGLRPTDVGIGSAIRRHADRFPALVVFPQAHPDCEGWRGDTAAAAMRALDRTIAEFHGDPSRLYLTGLSMGGSGTLRVAAAYPGRFAALVPICPDFDGELTRPGTGPTRSLTGSARPRATDGSPANPFDALAKAIGPVPAWIFQGEDDDAPSPPVTRHLVRALRLYSPTVRYTEYPRVGHNVWDPAYADPTLMAWLLTQQRRP
jgi:predicted peptidase